MEENVALDKASQSSFSKAVKNVKQLIKKGTVKVADTAVQHGTKVNKSASPQSSGEGTGVVYLSHIPHGFYEEQMRGYFSQFGRVLDVHLARSQRTGNSKGYAFIEFLHASVAKVAAETMNNYLMFNRLLQAKYLEDPLDRAWRKTLPQITPETCKTALNRKKNTIRKNRMLLPSQVDKAIEAEKKKLQAIKEKLKVNGIDLDFEIEHSSPSKTSIGKVTQDSEEDMETSHSDIESDCGAPVLELDESDVEISFNPPPGMLVRRVNRSKRPTASSEETPSPKKGKKIMSKHIDGSKTDLKLTHNKNVKTPKSKNKKDAKQSLLNKRGKAKKLAQTKKSPLKC